MTDISHTTFSDAFSSIMITIFTEVFSLIWQLSLVQVITLIADDQEH